jgi:eukaryotic-like serine/threonine-protein kinase
VIVRHWSEQAFRFESNYFSIWDTRLQDFETIVKSTGYDATGDLFKELGTTWKEPGFSQRSTYPVVEVTWNHAQAFCKWLSKRDRSMGDLPQDRAYRLPKDEE